MEGRRLSSHSCSSSCRIRGCCCYRSIGSGVRVRGVLLRVRVTSWPRLAGGGLRIELPKLWRRIAGDSIRCSVGRLSEYWCDSGVSMACASPERVVQNLMGRYCVDL